MKVEVYTLIEYLHYAGVVSEEQKEMIEEIAYFEQFGNYYFEEGYEGKNLSIHVFITPQEELPNWLSQTPLQKLENHVSPEEWIRKWKDSLRPIALTTRLRVVPVEEPPENRAEGALYLIPGLAFGTGTHESTRLAARLLETTDPHGKRVLDVGCGSGILSAAAVLLGAESVLAVDNDPLAVEKAEEIAGLNRIQMEVRKSDLLSCLKTEEEFDIVVANLTEQLLCEIYLVVALHLVEDGSFIISGIMENNEEKVHREFSGLFAVKETLREGGWIASILTRR